MSAPRSAALALYLAASAVAGPLARVLLARRARRGREDPARLGERLGRPSAPRPAGPLAWVHAASVGESLSVLPLLAALRAERPDLALLVTTGTVTSATLMAERLPAGAMHQFVPVDTRGAVRGFLEHWRPDLAIWVESELWPRMIVEARARGARMALVNARLSARSAAGWGRAPAMARRLLGCFDVIAAQDALSAARLRELGADPVDTGSLKAGAAPPDLAEARAALSAAIGDRPVWLAASTHPGEEEAVARAHRVAAAACPGLLTLIAPRHPERGAEIVAALIAAGLPTSRRGAERTGLPGPGDAVHVLDTLGEMGAWLRLAPVCFLGGSLVPLGGHNPHEPAALGAAILHGPHVEAAAEAWAALDAAGGARQVADGPALGAAVAALLGDAGARQAMAGAARAALPDGAAALAGVLALLRPLLPAPAGVATGAR